MNSATSAERNRPGKVSLPDLLFALLLLLFAGLSWNASQQESVTVDEFRHLPTGVYYWQSHDYSFDPATPPLWKMAMALPAYLGGADVVRSNRSPEVGAGWEPWIVATDFMRSNAARYTGYLQAARMVTLLCAAAGIIFLYARSRKRFGAAAALYGTGFLALSPTLLAHSHYVTSDVIAMVTMMVTVFLLLDYAHSRSWRHLAGATVVFAISMACKFTALILLPLLVGLPLVAAWQQGRTFSAGGAATAVPLWRILLVYGRTMLLVLLAVLLLINLLYGFQGTGSPLAGMKLESRTLATLAQTPVGSFGLPLPRAFVEGFDRQKADSDYGEPGFFLGNWSFNGFRAYFPGAFCLKESVPFILLLLAAVFCRPRSATSPRPELFLLCYVPVVLLMVLSFMNSLNLGIRYLLPVYPFLCWFISRLYAERSGRPPIRAALVALFVLHCVSVARVSPHYTAYFNEICGGPENGYRYLVDSNLDWGQDLIRLKKYMSAHAIDKVQLAYFGHALPEFYGINHELLTNPPKPGYVAVSASMLQGQPYLLTYVDPPQMADFDRFGFMRSFKPVGRAGYSILVYKIDGNEPDSGHGRQ